MKKNILELKIVVEYDESTFDEEVARCTLLRLADFAAGRGLLSDDHSPMTVDTWNASVRVYGSHLSVLSKRSGDLAPSNEE